MLQSELTVRSLKLIFVVNPLIVINFLILTQCILFKARKSIVYSQGLRIKRFCSKKDTFAKHLESLRSWFDTRGYPKELVDKKIRRVIERKEK